MVDRPSLISDSAIDARWATAPGGAGARRVGPFEVIERLGRGGFGTVYRAREVGGVISRVVCIKRLHHVDPATLRAFHEEARVLASIRHANVVSLHGVADDPGVGTYLVLEFVDGCDLARLAHGVVRSRGCRGLLPDPLAVFVACAVLRALGAMQRAMPGVVHRDVSPGNILVSREGEVKLTDFGIALAKDRARDRARDRDRWTSPRTIKGKPGYLSPEQARGESLDLRSDLFSLGIVLYQLLSREKPWGTLGAGAQLEAIASGRVSSIACPRPDLDRRLVSAVDHLLAPRVSDRVASADDALRALAPHSAGELGSLCLAELMEACLHRSRSVRGSSR